MDEDMDPGLENWISEVEDVSHYRESDDRKIVFAGPEDAQELDELHPEGIVGFVQEVLEEMKEEFQVKDSMVPAVFVTDDDDLMETHYLGSAMIIGDVMRVWGAIRLGIPSQLKGEHCDIERMAQFVLTDGLLELHQECFLIEEFGCGLGREDKSTYRMFNDRISEWSMESKPEWLRDYIRSSVRHEFAHHVTPRLECMAGFLGSYLEEFSMHALYEGFARLVEGEYRTFTPYHCGEILKEAVEGVSGTEPPEGIILLQEHQELCSQAGLYVASSICDAFGADQCRELFTTADKLDIQEAHTIACEVLSEELGYEVVPLFT